MNVHRLHPVRFGFGQMIAAQFRRCKLLVSSEMSAILLVPKELPTTKFTHLTRTDREIIRRMRGTTSLSAIRKRSRCTSRDNSHKRVLVLIVICVVLIAFQFLYEKEMSAVSGYFISFLFLYCIFFYSMYSVF
jgi:hypothetical protein